MDPASPKDVKQRHHPGLAVLFFTEMWERFSFYSIIALLSLYMDAPAREGGLGFSSGWSAQVYGLYTGLVYFTPFVGGFLADRFWGYRLTVTLGGLSMMAGHFLLAFPPIPFFFLGLLCLIAGNGLFKPNISTMVGNLYRDRPQLKDAAFNIFYMGINTGAFAAPLVASWLKNHFKTEEAYGWHWAFAAAGAGMIVSLIIFLSFRKVIAAGERSGEVEGGAREEEQGRPSESVRVQALFIVYGVVILFWMAYMQNGLTLNFWARDNTENLWGIDFKEQAEITQSINPLFIILFTFPLVGSWAWLRRKGKEPSTPKKLIIGMALTSLSFVIMGAAGLQGGDTGKVSAWWLIVGYAVVTVAELCLSPMGLSLASKLAPARHAGLFMGLWFVANAFGNYLSGLVGMLWNRWSHSTFFFFLAGSSLFAAGILRLLLGRLEAAMPPEKPSRG